MLNWVGSSSRLLLVALLTTAFAPSTARAAPPPNPRVGIMPGFPNSPHCDPSEKRKVRPGVPVIVWGNANGGNGTALGNPYAFTFSANPNVLVTPVSPPLNGLITSDRYIYEEVQFTLLGGSTKECITATLSVTFPGPVTLSKSVEIVMIAPTDPSSTAPLDNLEIDVDIAIEDGLRALYLMQNGTSQWPSTANDAQRTCASTGFALWAFQNQGHVRSNPQGDDIYAEFVESGLESIMAGASAFGTVAANADVPRGAVANGVSDLNSNNRSINLCPPPSLTAWYPPPIAAAAIIASLEPGYVVQTGPFAGSTFQTILEDVIDWIGTAQNSVSATGPRGGWHYSANVAASDMSINSWYYLALEGIQFILPPCNLSGGGSGVTVPDWIKQEAEHALVFHQTNAPGPQPFGYQNAAPLAGPTEGIATTAGGLSGLALVETESVTLPVQDIIDNEPLPLNSIAAKRKAALDHIGQYWNNTVNSQLLGYGNRGNFYVMWTAARALRVTAKALGLPAGQKVILTHGGVDFDWESGETFIAGVGQGNVPIPGNPREGYFPYLVRTQDTASGPTTRGRWSLGTYLSGFEGSPSMETALGVLVLIDRVFGPRCQISCKDIVVKCDNPQGAVVNFNPTVSGCAQGSQVICSPPSGSIFPVGTTSVICYVQEPCSKRRSLPCCFKVTVEECKCLEVKDQRIECSQKTSGAYQYSFAVTNLSGVPVKTFRLLPCDMNGDFLPDFTMTPDTFNLGTPLPNGGTTTLNTTISGADPDKPACFEIWMFDEKHQRCCVVKHCVSLPECCLKFVENKVECDPLNPGQYIFTFAVKNLAPYPIDRLFLYPQGAVTMTPSSFIFPPIPTGGTSGSLTVSIAGAAPGSTICFEVSIHEAKTARCCFSKLCLQLPDCNPCSVEDLCELTPAIKLCREGDLLRGTIKLTICNYCNAQPTAFKYSLDGFTDPSCPIQYLNAANFTPSSGVTAPIPRGQCVTIPITISSNFGQFPPGAVACFKATVTNTQSGESFSCTGKAKSPKLNDPIKIVADPKDPVGVPKGRSALVVFEVRNEGTTAVSLSYELRTELPGLSSSKAISLNGLPPGQPVLVPRGLQLPGGAVSQVAVEVSFQISSPLGFGEIFMVTRDSAGEVESLAATAVRSISPEDCNQNGIPDDVDIAVSNSLDVDNNGIPDECGGGIPLLASASFLRGDANTDGLVNVSDSLSILDALFMGKGELRCMDAADADDRGSIEIADAVGILSFLFLGGHPPLAPWPASCGLDITEDALGCDSYAPCD